MFSWWPPLGCGWCCTWHSAWLMMPCHPSLPGPSCPPRLPGAGYFNLIYTPPSSRRRGLQVMTASERGEHMPLVKQRRVAALALEPQSTGGWWVSIMWVGAALGAYGSERADGDSVMSAQRNVPPLPGLCRHLAGGGRRGGALHTPLYGGSRAAVQRHRGPRRGGGKGRRRRQCRRRRRRPVSDGAGAGAVAVCRRTDAVQTPHR